jgi:60kDa lysophospholipase
MSHPTSFSHNTVVEYAKKSTHFEDMTTSSLSRVLVLYCGGTIGMKHEPDKGYFPIPGYLTDFLASDRRFHDKESLDVLQTRSLSPFDINSMKKELGKILLMPTSMYGKKIAYQIYEYDPLKDSSNINMSDWIRIASDIESYYHFYDAFIVLHGTDTMAYSASTLSFLLENLGKTVIFTGSQIPFSELRNDAYDNFLGALTLAGHYVIPEVTLFFNNKLLRGNRSSKVNAVDFDAFDSPNLKPLAQLAVKIKIDWREILRCTHVAPFKVRKVLDPNVGALRLFPGIPASAIRAFTAEPMRGVVLETFGTGNAPDDRPDLLEAFSDAVSRGVVIVNITQCRKGAAMQMYSTGHVLSSTGVIIGGDMTTECALAKLSYLLGNPAYDTQMIRRLITEPMRGELTPPDLQLHTGGVEIRRDMGTLASLLSLTLDTCPPALQKISEAWLRPMFMHHAATHGDPHALHELNTRHINLDSADYEERTCLHLAVIHGRVDTVKWLVSNGANVHIRDRLQNNSVSEPIYRNVTIVFHT